MSNQLDGTEIAIIGMAGRFPGARNIQEFWRNLRDGVEGISFFSGPQLEQAGANPALIHEPNYVKAAALIEDAYGFDASFFGYNPREAELMDPQHRVLLETAWEALENAGYDCSTYKGSIGVFAGATINTYLLLNIASNPEITDALEDVQINMANGGDFLTTRISYKLNLRGPSHLVQSACSTSLVATHLACQSLLNDESDIALAGGVSINEKMRYGYRFFEGGMVSPDGHCRAFDAKAQGTIFGSGAGIIVLKRIEDALSDGDTIRALIKGSAINNDGSLKVGYTAPSVDGQAEVITEAMANAGVSPDTVTYIEAHGTGTPLGDPIEVQALTKAFRAETSRKSFCGLGSVKTNIGHLDAAAGVTGLIKTILALEHKQLPPSLHFENPNPQIDFENSPFYVVSNLKEWKSERGPRRAGVSAFGVGGTNAHIVVEEFVRPEPSGPSRSFQLIPLSARTSEALDKATENLAEYLRHNNDTNTGDVSYTLKVGRQAFNHRRAFVCEDAETALASLDSGQMLAGISKATPQRVAFLFPGQGSQYVNMGAELYKEEASFREDLSMCARLLKPHIGLNIQSVLYPGSDNAERAAALLNSTEVTQPALFAIEYALARLWMRWGVRPAAMIGHSIGEYTAACLAGVMTLEDALRIVAARGQLMQSLPGGSMISTGLGREEAEQLLSKELSIAAVNGPGQSVISGPDEAIRELEQRLESEGIFSRKLQTSHAFHSEMMEPILDEFRQQVSAVRLNAPQIPFISNVTGTWITNSEATDPGYWTKHLRQTVLFLDGSREMMKDESLALLEVGPGETLSRVIKRQAENLDRIVVASLPRPDEKRSAVECVLTSMARLWIAGAEVDWNGYYKNESRRRIPLPTYAFQRHRYRIEPGLYASSNREASVSGKREQQDWFYVPSWKMMLTGRKKAGLAESGSDQSQGVWIVFEDSEGIGEELSRRLREERAEVVRVEIGERKEREEYEEVMKEIEKAGKRVEGIAHLWSVSREEGEEFKRSQERGFQSLLFLAQALESRAIKNPIRLCVVSNRVQSITPTEVTCPEKATLLGACKVIPQEFPLIGCKSVDIVIPDSQGWQRDRLVNQLIAELGPELSDPVVALRGDQRWVRSYERIALSEASHSVKPIRRNGIYMITGGLTGIGFILSRYLSESFQARLALIEDASFPEREQWSAYLASHSQEDETSRRIVRAKSLESKGGQAIVISARLSDADQMQAAVARTVKEFGDLNGVIHAASAPSDKSFRTISEIEVGE